jgi:acyl-CoA thioester hydrolase
MDSALGRFPVSVTIPVAWGDMDAFQHVNNVTYARWIETARVAYFTRIGLMCPPRPDGVGPIVARLAINYEHAIFYPDTVRVEATIRAIGRTSLTMGYRIFSQSQGAEVATAEDVMVLLDYAAGKKAPVDDALRATIHALEATGAPAARGPAAPAVRS